MRRRRWQHLTGLKGPISDDTFDYVTERLWAEDLRQAVASVVKKLKANKALESCKINGLLFLSLDANEHCKSRSRCCAGCGQREIVETDAQGQKRTVIKYYQVPERKIENAVSAGTAPGTGTSSSLSHKNKKHRKPQRL